MKNKKTGTNHERSPNCAGAMWLKLSFNKPMHAATLIMHFSIEVMESDCAFSHLLCLPCYSGNGFHDSSVKMERRAFLHNLFV